jgi:thiamine biosynthesis lipoprotein
MTGIARFPSMGCDVLVAGASADELAGIEALFAGRDATFSRFIAGSELNRVNAAAGSFVSISPLFAAALETALGMAELTGGTVDPTVGAAIVAAGYDRDFALLGDDPRPAAAPAMATWRSVELRGELVRVLSHVRLDLNGVVKSMAVDAAVALISAGGWVSAGGDLAATVPVDVALPGGGAVRLERGGLATSGSVRRRWRRGGREQHHLIDPASGRPSASPWTQVTVSGSTCLEADVAAKAGFLLGAEGPGWLADRAMPARLLAGRGETLTPAWREAVEACI